MLKLYQLIRFVFVTVWFYYLPVMVMALGYIYPLMSFWECKLIGVSGTRLKNGVCIDPVIYNGPSLIEN